MKIWLLELIGGAIVLELLLVYAILPLIAYIRNRLAPVRHEKVRVLRVEQRTGTHISGRWLSWLIFGRFYSYLLSIFINDDISGSVVDDIDTYIYFVTFEAENERRLEFRVTEDEYDQFQPDESGILTYQGGRLCSFEAG